MCVCCVFDVTQLRTWKIKRIGSGSDAVMIQGARVSHPDPRINVGFRERTIIGAGEAMEDAVRLVYSGGEPALSGGESSSGRMRVGRRGRV